MWYIIYFNPRSREGSDSFKGYTSRILRQISIHAPARGATFTNIVGNYTCQFQSTLPRGERPDSSIYSEYDCIISIHAPARGATRLQIKSATIIPISIHAPARGATDFQPCTVCLYYDFNPRSREGSDFKSKHNHFQSYRNFNPRSREGSDLLPR